MINNSFLQKFYIKFPVVKIFNLNNGKFYIYDAKSAFLTEVSSRQLRLIYQIQDNTGNRRFPKYLIKLFENNVFRPGAIEKLTPSPAETKKIVADEVENQIPRKFTLEISEKCTLRCRYCLYTNDDFHKRKHSQKSMKKEIAFKAIDWYFSRYTSAISKIPEHRRVDVYKTLPPVLIWWGGEPFTEFELLKETKHYIESLNWGLYGIKKDDIHYNIVTNLTILNDEIIDFLVTNEINLQVSLDGDQKEHDKNRVFPNGEGSFQKVFNNINELISRHPKYVKNHLTINTVLADNIDHDNASTFINEYFDVGKYNRKISLWNPTFERHEGEIIPRGFFIHDTNAQIAEFRKNFIMLKSKGIDYINEFLFNNKALYNQLLELYLLEQKIEFDYPNSKIYLPKTFSCPLGSDTLFVSTNGDLHCCNQVDYSFPLGNVYQGLITEKMESVYNSYFKKIDTQCKKCWAVIFCKICPALVCLNSEFKLPSMRECESMRNIIETNILAYIILSTEFESLHPTITSFFDRMTKDTRHISMPTKIKDFMY